MTAILVAMSTVFAVVPMLGMLAVVWWLDRYDREPIGLLFLTFAWGAVGAVLLAVVGSTILLIPLSFLDEGATGIGAAVIVAPLVEEPAKALILGAILLTRHFDNMTDGFVYGAAAGLGFGMTENFLYFTEVASYGELPVWIATVIIRTGFSAVMHAMATSVVGAALGFARFRGPLLLAVAGVVGLFGAMTIHGVWNALIAFDAFGEPQGLLFAADIVLLPCELVVLFVVFQMCLWDERRVIRAELADEAGRGLIPSDHPRILSSFRVRMQRRWLPAGVDHHAYVRAATMLAMRKSQARMASGAEARRYAARVEALRVRVAQILGDRGLDVPPIPE